MNRRRWFIWRRMAVWFWGFLAVLITIDIYSNAKFVEQYTERKAVGAFGEADEMRSVSAKDGGEAGSRISAADGGRAENCVPAGNGGEAESQITVADGDKADSQALTTVDGRAESQVPASSGSGMAVALTFDDGPHPVYTPRLLDGLRARGIRASFFLIGQSIDGNEDILLQMKEDGHLIGNHSQSHMQLTAESARAACEQIRYTNQRISAVTGSEPAYFRPPYGSWSDELGAMVPMTIALWNLDPLDWKSQNKDEIVRYVRNHVENGSIILLHDVYEPSVEAALEIADVLLNEGYEFVTVDELIIE